MTFFYYYFGVNRKMLGLNLSNLGTNDSFYSCWLSIKNLAIYNRVKNSTNRVKGLSSQEVFRTICKT